MGRTVWPMGAPKTIGTPSGRRIRAQTSFTVGAPATAGSLSGKSPSTNPRTPVEPGSYHGTVKSNPVAPLPEKNLQSSEVAESNHALEIGDAFLQLEFQQVIRTITAA